MYSHLKRRKDWPEKNWARVAFFGHALVPGFLSSKQIEDSLHKIGRDWPDKHEPPGFIRWLSFPAVPPPESGGRPVWVDFYVIPVFADRFLGAIRSNEAYSWVEAAAEYAILHDAKPDNVDLVIGWGAYTKVATDHGYLFRNRRPELADSPGVSTTHGDAGSAALTLEAVRLSGIEHPRLAVIGAYGAIGGVVSRAASILNPELILLVGQKDEEGKTDKFDKLQQQRRVVEECAGSKYPVFTHQNKARACLEHNINVVIVATGGNMKLKPHEVPEGALVLDVATPPACSPHADWEGRLVLNAGCGEFSRLSVIPEAFGNNIVDCGAGREHVLWGCAGETIARAMFRWKGNLVGTNIPTEELIWSRDRFREIGFVAQPPTSFGKALSWQGVKDFCAKK